MASTTGIRTRHSRSCKTRQDGGCNCEPTYEAFVYSKREGKKIRRSFTGKGAYAAAKGWRTDAQKQVKDRRLRAPSAVTLRQEVDEWLAGARDGSILNKRKQPRIVFVGATAARAGSLPLMCASSEASRPRSRLSLRVRPRRSA